jgi:hypothetical protein
MTWRVQMKTREPGGGSPNFLTQKSVISLRPCSAWGSRPKRTPVLDFQRLDRIGAESKEANGLATS